MRGNSAPSILEGHGFAGRAAAGVYGAGLDVGASVSGEIYRDQAEDGLAGGTGDYGSDFE